MVTGRIARMRGMDQDKFDLKTLTRHFEVHNRSEGKSARTVEWYNGALELFQCWLEDEGNWNRSETPRGGRGPGVHSLSSG